MRRRYPTVISVGTGAFDVRCVRGGIRKEELGVCLHHPPCGGAPVCRGVQELLAEQRGARAVAKSRELPRVLEGRDRVLAVGSQPREDRCVLEQRRLHQRDGTSRGRGRPGAVIGPNWQDELIVPDLVRRCGRVSVVAAVFEFARTFCSNNTVRN